jgi:nitrogenase-associated protein
VAIVTFFEKPGCGTNGRQRRMLEAAGHTVMPRDLLSEPWSADRLRGFFAGTPVASWFNPAAPRVKSGEIDPATIDAEAALALMLEDPLLIRRPLVEADSKRCAGFDREPVATLLGRPTAADDEACSRAKRAEPCPEPHRS